MKLEEVPVCVHLTVLAPNRNGRHDGRGELLAFDSARDHQGEARRVGLRDVTVVVAVQIHKQPPIVPDLGRELGTGKSGGIKLVGVGLVIRFGVEIVHGESVSLG